MARYQLRRPSPVQIIPRRVRRQDATATTMPVNEDKGPESPDSPFSSPSTVGGSDSESSDSEDEEDEKKDEKKSSSSPTKSSPSQPVQTLGPDPTQKPSLPASLIENNSTVTSQTYDGVLSMIPSTTLGTTTSATSLSSSPYRTQSERKKQASPTASPTTSTATSSITSLPPVPVSSAEAEMNGQTGASQMLPQDEPIMTKEAMIAAIVLGVLGVLALLAAAVIFFKRHRWRKRMNHMPLQDEPYDAPNGQFPSPPDVAHVGTASSVFARLNGAANGGAERHLTRSTERSNTLFGASPYIRPETVSTDRNNSRMPPPTPNPFADPQRNKAYDMLNNRPRSTTLTDRGSWRENPFKNPASERFDPFGELKEKARRERLKYLQEAKREAELQRQMQQKEAMGLRPDDMPWGADNGYR